jgi:hypothetical protein
MVCIASGRRFVAASDEAPRAVGMSTTSGTLNLLGDGATRVRSDA